MADVTIDQVLADAQEESTVGDSLIALTARIKTELDAALANVTVPPDVQAKINQVFDVIEANKAKAAAAILANTPSA